MGFEMSGRVTGIVDRQINAFEGGCKIPRSRLRWDVRMWMARFEGVGYRSSKMLHLKTRRKTRERKLMWLMMQRGGCRSGWLLGEFRRVSRHSMRQFLQQIVLPPLP